MLMLMLVLVLIVPELGSKVSYQLPNRLLRCNNTPPSVGSSEEHATGFNMPRRTHGPRRSCIALQPRSLSMPARRAVLFKPWLPHSKSLC
ncbi:hypothetical protein VFPFJ_06819 [Purpureocillium lilacinum]|uniref:Secreted protein n=1 Tax=Purpureocillium lilacinum TaxID=33203 RepID=A0A179HEA1_PURLI|nr:hypothetical protein VFPFJ_06819 [Purpureocillium lilacinum]OAQ88354.1 hypothetical protein VFPFJ_06819 [Purpureocillium lilacinum]